MRVDELYGFKMAPHHFGTNEQLVNEVLLSRLIESYNYCLTEIMSEAFTLNPDMLRSKESLTENDIIDAGGYQEIIRLVVDKKVLGLAYKSVRDVAKSMSDNHGITLTESKEQLDALTVAVEIRNLIAHNDCIINDQFWRKVSAIKEPLGAVGPELKICSSGKIAFPDKWLWDLHNLLNMIVYKMDEQFRTKFRVEDGFSELMVIPR